MSLLFFDGFDQYVAQADLVNYGGWYAENGITISTTVRVGSGKSLLIGQSSYQIIRALKADQAGNTLYTGFAFARNGNGSGGCLVLLAQNVISNYQCCMVLNTSNKIEIRIGNYNGTVLATGTTVLANLAWYYIEAKIKVASTGGIFEVKINGAVEVSFTGNTQLQANNSVNCFILGAGPGDYNSPPGYYDDLYMLNSLGTLNNTYLGEQIIEIMNPNADSAITWSRNAGTTNYGRVLETLGAPDTTTYVYSNTSGNKDLYGYAGLTGMNVVSGVKVLTRAQKDSVNAKSFKHGIKIGTVEQKATYSLTIGYANYQDIYETSDGVNTALLPTDITNLKSVIEVV